MTEAAWTFVWGIIILAIVYMLVKPGSIAAQATADVSSTLKNIVTAAVS